MSRFQWKLLAFALVAARCTDPDIREDTAAACHNGIDDDGNGLIDCADPACAGTGLCETGAAVCHDGIDNDHDGRTDCQEASCVVGGFCDATPTACVPLPQSGCHIGQGCYQSFGTTGDVSLVCRVAGSQPQATCSGSAVTALGPRQAHPCIAGQGCSRLSADIGICAAYCMSDNDCPAGAICQLGSQTTALCSVPCNPVNGLGCPSDQYACRSRAETLSLAFSQGGARFQCVATTLPQGQGRVGDPCDDPPSRASDPTRVCGQGSVCIPFNGAVLCRASCNVNTPGCPGGLTCRQLYTDGRPSAFGPTVFGACVP